MQDGSWRTLEQIARETGDPLPSTRAQPRHLRKRRFGAHTVKREHIGDALYRYQLVVRELVRSCDPVS